MKFIKRPQSRTPRRHSVDHEILRALFATYKNGKAVAIPLDGDDATTVRLRYYVPIKRRGLRLVTQRKENTLLAWVMRSAAS